MVIQCQPGKETAPAILANVMTVGPSRGHRCWCGAAQIIERLPDPAKVLQDAQRLVPDENRNYAPFVLVGMLAEQAKRPDDAMALYDKAIAREPKASIAYWRKADLLIRPTSTPTPWRSTRRPWRRASTCRSSIARWA